MFRAIILLVATLAAIALAAPAPLPAAKPSFFGDLSTKQKTHSFKSFTYGHRRFGHRHRNPIAELSRVYNKFHWSISLPLIGSITVDLPNATDSGYDSPDGGADAGAIGGGYDSGSDSGYGSSGDDGSGSFSTQSSISTSIETVQASSYGVPSPYGAPSATETSAIAMPSDVVYSSGVSVKASATAEPDSTATGSPSNGDGGSGEVNAHPEENESEYLSPVTIGGQKLNLNFDTGSADL